MSISGISGAQNLWQWQKQANASASGSAAASSATDSIANTGSVSAGNMAAFFQSFSSDLQSMLSQTGNATSTATPTQTTANQPIAAPHHRHRPHSSGGAVNQMTAQLGQDPSGLSSAASGVSSSAGKFAADVMQALRAYGTTVSATTTSASIA